MNLHKHSKIIILKLDLIRLIQHELTHLLLRELADDVNASTPHNVNNILVDVSIGFNQVFLKN